MELLRIINKLEKINENNNTEELELFIKELKVKQVKNGKIKNTTILSLCKDMIKTTEGRAYFTSSTYKIDNKYFLCDGFRIIKFNNENDKVAEKLYNSENKLNVTTEKLTNGLKFNEVEINLKELNKIINYNEMQKSKGKIEFPFIFKYDKQEYAVNGKWLKQMLDITKSNKVFVTNNNKSPIMIKSIDYDMLLLPINLNYENDYYKAIYKRKKFYEIVNM